MQIKGPILIQIKDCQPIIIPEPESYHPIYNLIQLCRQSQFAHFNEEKGAWELKGPVEVTISTLQAEDIVEKLPF